MAVIRRKKIAKGSAQKMIPSQTTMTAERVIEMARASGLNTNPLDIIGLVRAIGIRLNIKPMDNEVSGYLEEEDGAWTIAINSLHHPKRQRFTIAHELGHYFLHRNLRHAFVDKVLFRNGNSNPIEVQANKFAGELLMPEGQFRDYVSASSSRVEDISEFFSVSAMAVRVRASQLGYGGHNL